MFDDDVEKLDFPTLMAKMQNGIIALGKFDNTLSNDWAIPFLGNESINPYKNMHTNVLSSFMCNNKKLESTHQQVNE